MALTQYLFASVSAVSICCGYTSRETAHAIGKDLPDVRCGLKSTISKFARQKQVQLENLTLLLLGGCTPFELRGPEPTAALSVIIYREVISLPKYDCRHDPVFGNRL